MCGIAGWVDYKGITKAESILNVMAQTIVPRGPDSKGIYLSDICGLAHRRLAVIDVARGTQPITREFAGDKCTMVYNGELYNADELKGELIKMGFSFSTSCDTEVLLNSYLAWGEACFDKLNGIYAFAVWSERERQLFLARDRMGVKPLFYYEYEGGIIFGSEIKTLLSHPYVKPVIDNEGIADIMLLGPGRRPGYGVFKGVRELIPGECGYFSSGGLKKRRYWKLRAAPHKESFEETAEHTAYLLNDAIKRQLVSDVPLCTFLSGGLDSSVISAVAAAEYKRKGKQLTTCSIDYKDNAKNFTASKFQPDMDAPWIERMVHHIGSQHIYTELDTPALTDALIPSVYARDLPGMADVDSSLYLFCKEIKKHHTVALSGECADEIFGGYPWYHDEEMMNKPGFPWAKSAAERGELINKGLLKGIDPSEYVTACANATLEMTEYSDTDTKKERRMREMFMLNIYWFMQCLLDRKDRMSMASGLEVRVPFCDHRIAAYAYNIPWEYKAREGREKGLVRHAITGILPQDVLWRKKSPYPKTHNPTYLNEVIRRTREILLNENCRITEIIDRKKLISLCDDPSLFKGNWYGQLMTAPQMFAYIIQTEAWLTRYDIHIERS